MTDHSDEEALGRLRALGPLGNVDQLQENVRRRLDAPEPRAAWFQGRPRKAVWAGGLTLAAAAVAATSFWGAAPSESAQGTPAGHQAPPPAPVTSPPVAPPQAPSPQALPPSNSIQEAPPTPTDAKKPDSRTPVASSAPRTNLLYQAATALRHDNDPSRALGLLDDYVRATPAAAGSEEVQALRMEAYYRLGSPRAAQLASAYLKAFPQGRFRQTAQNISGQPSPSPSPSSPVSP